jgi:hypothetical protein
VECTTVPTTCSRAFRRCPGKASVLLGFCPLLFGGCASAKTEQSPPRLLLPASPLDLGHGTPGELLTGSVRVQNVGGQPLLIRRVEAGCACSSVRLSQEALAPGAEAELEVSARIRSGQQRLAFPVYLYSNDPSESAAVLQVVAQHGPPVLRIEPATLDFGEIPVGTATSRQILPLTPDGRPWPAETPISATTASRMLKVTTQRLEARDGPATVAVEVQVPPEVPLGRFDEALVLRPVGGSRSLEVAVQGKVVPRVIVSPTARRRSRGRAGLMAAS